MSQMLSETASLQYLPNADLKTAVQSEVSMQRDRGTMPRKKIDALVAFAKDYGAKGLAYLAIQ